MKTLTETLSFRETASRLKVSQSTISRAIARIEEQLGSQLFSREGGKVWLSAFGQSMKPLLDDLLTGMEKAERHAGALLRAETGKLRIGIDDSAPFSLFADLFKAYTDKMQAVELEFIHATGASLETMLLEAELDAAIVDSAYGISDLCQSTLLFREPYVLAASEATKNELGASQVSDYLKLPVVANSVCFGEDCIRKACGTLGCTPPSVVLCERVDWLLGFTRSGLGVGVLPRALAMDEGFHIIHSIEHVAPLHDLCFLTARGRAFTPALRALDLETTLLLKSKLPFRELTL